MTVEKIKVVFQSIVLWLGIVIAALPLVITELSAFAEEQGWASDVVTRVVAVLVGVLAVVTVIVKIIQRVSPALPSEFGILPGSAAKGAPDQGLSLIETIIIVVLAVLACYAVYVLFA